MQTGKKFYQKPVKFLDFSSLRPLRNLPLCEFLCALCGKKYLTTRDTKVAQRAQYSIKNAKNGLFNP
jgi:hypothetical protein